MRYRISGPRAALVAASCALLAASAALAAEPATECQKACPASAAAGHVTARVEVGVPVLSKIPYISRLFTNVGIGRVETCESGQCQQTAVSAPASWAVAPASHCTEGATCPVDGTPQYCEVPGPAAIHAPVKIFATPSGLVCIAPSAAASCGTSACTNLTAANVCDTVTAVAVVDKGCPAGQCAAPACCETKVSVAGKCGEACACPATSACQAASIVTNHVAAKAGCTDCKCAGDDKTTVLWKQIVELAAKAAASEAKAEAEIKAHQSTLEIFEGLAEVTAEKAALEAKVEAQQAQFATMEKLVELAMENTKLKAEVEKLTSHVELTGEAMEIALENELLKRRVEELEARVDAPAARTASKPKR